MKYKTRFWKIGSCTFKCLQILSYLVCGKKYFHSFPSCIPLSIDLFSYFSLVLNDAFSNGSHSVNLACRYFLSIPPSTVRYRPIDHFISKFLIITAEFGTNHDRTYIFSWLFISRDRVWIFRKASSISSCIFCNLEIFHEQVQSLITIASKMVVKTSHFSI